MTVFPWTIFSMMFEQQPAMKDIVSPLGQRTDLFPDRCKNDNITLQDKGWSGLLAAPFLSQIEESQA